MRTANSMRNAVVGTFVQALIILAGFVSQAVLVRTLGDIYNGVNGVCSNILSMLNLAELGVGTAMVYSLYKPFAYNDQEQIKSIMALYRKAYRIIALIVLGGGIVLLPFLHFFFHDVPEGINVYVIFMLFVADACLSYTFSYKRSMLYADQKEFLIKLVHILYVFGANAGQIIILLTLKDYILVLILKIFFKVLDNLIICTIVNRKYPYIKEKQVHPLDDGVKHGIMTNVKALFVHRLAGVVVNGSDNLILSVAKGIVSAGLYTNYNLIINNLKTLIVTFFRSITASFGNLLVKNRERAYEVFEVIFFADFWVFTFASTCLLNLMDPFISIWVGADKILPWLVEYTLVLNFYIQGMRQACAITREAAGLYKIDRFVPFIESAINLVASILLVQVFGIAGIFMGTIISTLCTVFISVPYIAFRHVLHKPLRLYYIRYAFYFGIALATCAGTTLLCNALFDQTGWLALLGRGAVCAVLPNVLLFLLFFRTRVFQEFKVRVMSVWKAKRSKSVKQSS
ncbi:MAG: hypothetical protein HFE85_00130 [Clostridiales bacterium]|nr:hypothetical protein [Clostridiales bacterium]